MINSVILFHETAKSHCTVNNLLPDGKMILLVLNTMYWNDNRYSDPLVDQIAESQMQWFSDQRTKKILNIQEMTFVCVLIRTEAKIFWYARSVVDKSITRAFRQAKSYSAFDQLLVRLPSSVVFERLFVLHSLF